MKEFLQKHPILEVFQFRNKFLSKTKNELNLIINHNLKCLFGIEGI